MNTLPLNICKYLKINILFALTYLFVLSNSFAQTSRIDTIKYDLKFLEVKGSKADTASKEQKLVLILTEEKKNFYISFKAKEETNASLDLDKEKFCEKFSEHLKKLGNDLKNTSKEQKDICNRLFEQIKDKYESFTLSNNPFYKKLKDDSEKRLKVGYIKILDNDLTKDIERVKLEIRNGVLYIINLHKKDSIYTNQRSPIDLTNYRRRNTDMIHKIGKNEQKEKSKNPYLILGEIIEFDTDYYPNDTIIELSKDNGNINTKVDLYASANLNSFLTVKVFSDLLALLADKGNGLIQTEANAQINVHRTNVCNSYSYFFSNIEPHILYSKFDSKFQKLELTPLNSRFELNSIKTLQNSFIQFGLNTDAFTWFWNSKKRNKFTVNAGVLWYINDLITSDTKVEGQVISFAFTAQISNRFSPLPNVYCDVNFRLLKNQLTGTKNLDSKEIAIKNKDEIIFNPNLLISFYPVEKKTSNLFFKFSYFSDFQANSYNFYQMQVGYSITVADILDFAKNKK